MSRHTYQGKRYQLVLGLDAPLRAFFGHVQSEVQPPRQLGEMDEFDASREGLDNLLQAASEYEPVPPTIVDSLTHDLATLGKGADLSYERVHSTPTGDSDK